MRTHRSEKPRGRQSSLRFAYFFADDFFLAAFALVACVFAAPFAGPFAFGAGLPFGRDAFADKADS